VQRHVWVCDLSPLGEVSNKRSNIAFGGPDGRTTYVTLQNRGAIETFFVESPGEWHMLHGAR
jgi:hypothetical protein